MLTPQIHHSRRLLIIVLAMCVMGAISVSHRVMADGAAAGCVKAKLTGTATTYNTQVRGWKTGTGTFATGGAYNPNEYTAALQLDLAKQYRCGYGSSRCQAVVEGNGHAMIVLINDNGPMCADPTTARAAKDCTTRTSRVIDLNEKSMRYMSNGTMGNNSGTIPNVTVTLLCDLNNMLGPLNEKERADWMNRNFGLPDSNVGGSNLLTQATNGNQGMWQNLGQPLLGNSQQPAASVPSSYSTTPASGYSSTGYSTGQTGSSVNTTPVSTSLSGSTGQTTTGTGNSVAQSLLDAVNGKGTSTKTTNTNNNYNDNGYNPIANTLGKTQSQLTGSSINPASTTLGSSVTIGRSQPTTFGDTGGSVDTSNGGSDLSSADQSGGGGDASSNANTKPGSTQGGVVGAASDVMANVRAILTKIVTILKNILASLAAKLMGN